MNVMDDYPPPGSLLPYKSIDLVFHASNVYRNL